MNRAQRPVSRSPSKLALLVMASTMSDAKVAAGLVEIAADPKDQEGKLPPPAPEPNGAAGLEKRKSRPPPFGGLIQFRCHLMGLLRRRAHLPQY